MTKISLSFLKRFVYFYLKVRIVGEGKGEEGERVRREREREIYLPSTCSLPK